MSDDMMKAWDRKELWRRRGDGFCVEVSHHTVEPSQDWMATEGKHRWCVYAYIYPAHPHFAAFAGNSMRQDAAIALPMHGGPSLLQWHWDASGNPTSVQVGADYNHLHDAGYTYCEDAESACSVFRDAGELFDWLAAKAHLAVVK